MRKAIKSISAKVIALIVLSVFPEKTWQRAKGHKPKKWPPSFFHEKMGGRFRPSGGSSCDGSLSP